MTTIQPDSRGGDAAASRHGLFGISAALTTPFREDLSIDLERMVAHGRALLEEGCGGLTLFGTTGEGASLTAGERTAVQQAVLKAGIAPEKLVVGISATALETALEQAQEALDAGIATLLVPPPFYFKGVSDEGLFGWYSAFMERVSVRGARVILYHIPQVTGIGLSLSLVRRLKQGWGDAVFGVKDSAGHWPTTEGFLGEKDLATLVGDERHLAAAARRGGAGAISGVANLFPTVLGEMVRTGAENADINALATAVCEVPVTPAIKALVGLKRGEPEWRRVRAPLEPTPAADIERLGRLVDALGAKRAA